jgi:hypothetical protein
MAKRAKNTRRIGTTAAPVFVTHEPLRVVFERPAYGLVGRLLVDAGLALTGAANRAAGSHHRGLAGRTRQAAWILADLGDGYYRRAGALWNGDDANAFTPMYGPATS